MHARALDQPLARRIRRALVDLAAATPLRVSRPRAWRVVRRFARATGCSRGEYHDLWSSPERWLGPFDGLPDPLRRALANAADVELRQRSAVAWDAQRRALSGAVFRLGSETARLGRRHRLERGWRRLAFRGVFASGRALMATCDALARGWTGVTRYAPFAQTSPIHALWRWGGIDPAWVAVRYLEGIPYDPAVSPVHGSPSPQAQNCAPIGVDLRPYVINSQVDATVRALTEREETVVEAATLRVGRVSDAFLRRKHGVGNAGAPAA